jgi:ATP-dependent Clp protease ATP-binding subunit ClpA
VFDYCLQVAVDPPNVEQATSILRGLRPRYERHHGITISEAALLAAAQLSARYISGRHLPDKAIDCLDEAAAQVRLDGCRCCCCVFCCPWRPGWFGAAVK